MLPWPDSLALFIVGLLRARSGEKDEKEEARTMRRNIMRCILLSYVITLRRVSNINLISLKWPFNEAILGKPASAQALPDAPARGRGRADAPGRAEADGVPARQVHCVQVVDAARGGHGHRGAGQGRREGKVDAMRFLSY